MAQVEKALPVHLNSGNEEEGSVGQETQLLGRLLWLIVLSISQLRRLWLEMVCGVLWGWGHHSSADIWKSKSELMGQWVYHYKLKLEAWAGRNALGKRLMKSSDFSHGVHY